MLKLHSREGLSISNIGKSEEEKTSETEDIVEVARWGLENIPVWKWSLFPVLSFSWWLI